MLKDISELILKVLCVFLFECERIIIINSSTTDLNNTLVIYLICKYGEEEEQERGNIPDGIFHPNEQQQMERPLIQSIETESFRCLLWIHLLLFWGPSSVWRG